MNLSVFNIFLGFAGLMLALYLGHKKRRKTEHFICPMRGNCNDVINSDYSRFLGIPVEYLGTAYYAFIAVAYGIHALWPLYHGLLTALLLSVSVFAVVFSFYLTFIQFFTLRKLCTWCLFSAVLTVLIFGIGLHGIRTDVLPFLTSAQNILLMLHVVVMAIGLGAASLADLFFFKFLKDFRISESEAGVLTLFSQVIWLSLGLIVVTGLALFLPNQTMLLTAGVFQMKIIVIAVIILNGALLNLFIAPRFLQIQFGKHTHEPGELVRTRRLAFIFGPVSVISWFSAFVLGMLEPNALPLSTLWRVYVAFLIIGALAGQIAERVIDWRARRVRNA